MKFRSSPSILLFLLIITPAMAAPKGRPTPSPTTSIDAALDRAAKEFSTAAEKFGKAVGKTADESTAGLQENMKHTMLQILHEMSDTMAEATKKIEGHTRASPKPSSQK